MCNDQFCNLCELGEVSEFFLGGGGAREDEAIHIYS